MLLHVGVTEERKRRGLPRPMTHRAVFKNQRRDFLVERKLSFRVSLVNNRFRIGPCPFPEEEPSGRSADDQNRDRDEDKYRSFAFSQRRRPLRALPFLLLHARKRIVQSIAWANRHIAVIFQPSTPNDKWNPLLRQAKRTEDAANSLLIWVGSRRTRWVAAHSAFLAVSNGYPLSVMMQLKWVEQAPACSSGRLVR